MSEHVLVVDDSREIADLVTTLLGAEGIHADACHDGESALERFAERGYGLVILDIMMPGLDGWEVCRRIRRTSAVPVLFLSAKSEEIDVVRGFSLDADDYITKPFKPFELIARVKARLRRAAQPDGTLCAQGIALEPLTHRATLHDLELSLTPKEFGILELLLRNAGRPVPNRMIYEEVWRDAYLPSANNTVMVHIRNLRHKLAGIDSSAHPIQTVWGVGYRVADGRLEAGE